MSTLHPILSTMTTISDSVLSIAAATLPSITVKRGDLWVLAGFLMLAWTLARMTIQRRRRYAAMERENRETENKLATERKTALPLSDAPIETQRWQIAMFDLQRELKGELDSRIAVVQMLMRQVDEKIARLESLDKSRG